ncbi:MAG: sugar ABC transporter substrate-binding protein [Mahellales bacterium]|jgi:ribose transport system substrate-binding protein
MLKRLLVLVMVIAVVMAMVVGCGQSGTPEEKPGTETPSEQPSETPDQEKPSDDEPLHIGYVCNFMSHEWYQNVTKGAQRRAEDLGIKLEIADADNDSAQQVSFAENFIAKGVDVLALTPVDATTLVPVVEAAKEKGIIVVTETNPVGGGEVTTVGNDNKAGGKLAGQWLGQYAKDNNIDLKVLVIGFPNFEDCRLRVEGFKEGLEESGGNYTIVQEVDSQGGKELALQVSTDALTANPDINAIFGINDDSTQGGIMAYESVGLDMDKLVAVGYGLEGIVGREALLNNTPVKAEMAMFPDFVGACLVDACLKAFNGEELPERYLTPIAMVTAENYSEFYTQQGDEWVMNFDAVEALLNK